MLFKYLKTIGGFTACAVAFGSPVLADESLGTPQGGRSLGPTRHTISTAPGRAVTAPAVATRPAQSAVVGAPDRPARSRVHSDKVQTADGAPGTQTAMLESLPTVKLKAPVEKTTMQIRTESAQMEMFYIDGLVAQSRGDDRAAHVAFLQAAEAGYAPAQRKLGEIYDKGNAAIPRDFASSIRWYQRARAQGENIPTPHTLRPVP